MIYGHFFLLYAVGFDAAAEAAEGAERSQGKIRGTEHVAGTPVLAAVVLQVGDTPAGGGGAMVDNLNPPFTNGAGQVGFNGALTSGDRFIWFDDGITFLDSSVEGSPLTGAESTMGIANAAGFLYNPSVDGDDSVWSHNGLVQRENVQAPGFPEGTNNTFNSRPTMLPGGQACWISGFDDSGGTSTLRRVLYTSPTAEAGDLRVVLRSNDVVDGLTIDRPSGVGFDYQISDDGSHHIHDLLMDTGSTDKTGRSMSTAPWWRGKPNRMAPGPTGITSTW